MLSCPSFLLQLRSNLKRKPKVLATPPFICRMIRSLLINQLACLPVPNQTGKGNGWGIVQLILCFRVVFVLNVLLSQESLTYSPHLICRVVDVPLFQTNPLIYNRGPDCTALIMSVCLSHKVCVSFSLSACGL